MGSGDSHTAPKHAFESAKCHSEFDPVIEDDRLPEPERGKFLATWEQYVSALGELIFPNADAKKSSSGLVIVAGSTSAGKSNIVRGLIHRHLSQLIQNRDSAKDRRPHLVTFEDPIETLCYPRNSR